MKKMKNVLNKALAALAIAASATSLCAPAYAEEAPAHVEEAYTVTEDEQGMVTIVFNEPIVLFREESYAEDDAEEDDGVMPCGTMSNDAIDRAYWGAYISADDKYYVSITSETHVTIRILYPDYGECLCNGDDVEKLYFYPAISGSENFVVDYTCYTKVKENTQNELIDKPAKIGGEYHKGYANPYFTINRITLYKA